MGTEEKYYEKLEEAETLLQHFQKCADDVARAHPNGNMQAQRSELESIKEEYRDIIEEVRSLDDTERGLNLLIRVCAQLEAELEEWHNKGITDRYTARYATDSATDQSSRSSSDSDTNSETRIFDP
ncbi:hypothetical protein [Halosegnis longus]|uniref:hypothetical protein n=1 Tax=Halosegnis longus TaxID=2216012 RepID=UPI00096ACC07|nr:MULTISPECIES: hypothetical protein [Halobacteriales]